MDRGAWQAIVHRVSKCQTGLRLNNNNLVLIPHLIYLIPYNLAVDSSLGFLSQDIKFLTYTLKDGFVFIYRK